MCVFIKFGILYMCVWMYSKPCTVRLVCKHIHTMLNPFPISLERGRGGTGGRVGVV